MPSPGRKGNGGVLLMVVVGSPSIQGDFFGNNSEALMYCISVSPLLALLTLNLEIIEKKLVYNFIPNK